MKFEEARKHIGMLKEEFYDLLFKSEYLELPTIDVIEKKQLPCGCIIEYSLMHPGSERNFSCPNPMVHQRDFNMRFLKEYEMLPGMQPKAIYKLHTVNFQGNGAFVRKHKKIKSGKRMKDAMLESITNFLDPVQTFEEGEDIDG